MVYESSYESGGQPFLPDTTRGYWSGPHDFVYAGLGLAFRLDIFSMSWFLGMESGVTALLPAFLLSLVLYVIPFMVIQSFMGQFSSSGIISSFRLSPLFKGIGYVTLVVNICIVAYFSIFAVVPMVYMFASLNPTLPWSCDGFKQWAVNLTEDEETNLCNINFNNASDGTVANGTAYANETGNANDTIYSDFVNHHIPSVLYFTNLYHDMNIFDYDDMEFSMSWQMIICTLLLWAVVAGIAYKLFHCAQFGTLIRYCVWTMMALLGFFIVTFSFLPGAGQAYKNIFVPSWRMLASGFVGMPIYGTMGFGPGWGMLITLSSYNKFKTNIVRTSWIIGLGQAFIAIALDLLLNFSERYFSAITNNNYYTMMEQVWIIYLSNGSVMAHLPWPNLWTFLFNFMLLLGAVIQILLQLHSILTTVYDEFVSLRERKLQVSMCLIGLLAVWSLYFTSNHGITYYAALAADTFITHTAINLLLILVVLWIYGRVRFQRDIEFMTGYRFSTWHINIFRFFSPLGMLLALLGGLYLAHFEHMFTHIAIDVLALILFIIIPLLAIPGYAVYKMSLAIGPLKTRFLRGCRPTDWVPVESEHRQKYDDIPGNTDMTKTFSELRDEEVA